MEEHPGYKKPYLFTAFLRLDPPEMLASEERTKELHQIADKISQIEGLRELGRDQRPYQVELHLQQT